MDFKKSDFFNRFKYSVVLVAISFFFFLFFWYLNKSSDSQSYPTHKKVLWFVHLIFLSPFIFISFKEISSFFTDRTFFSFTLFFLNLIFPILFSVSNFFFLGWDVSNKLISFYFLIFSFCFVFNIFLFFIFANENKKLENNKFNVLKIICVFYVFWNSIFFISFFNYFLIIFISFALCSLNDSLAYIFGIKIGKIKIFKYSPKKTLEGFIWSIFLTTLTCSLIFIFVLKNKLNVNHGWINYFLPLVFLFFSVSGHLGDYFFSKIKRNLNIKDFGSLLGKQGGFWDRFDSHSFVLTLMLWANFLFIFL